MVVFTHLEFLCIYLKPLDRLGGVTSFYEGSFLEYKTGPVGFLTLHIHLPANLTCCQEAKPQNHLTQPNNPTWPEDKINFLMNYFSLSDE